MKRRAGSVLLAVLAAVLMLAYALTAEAASPGSGDKEAAEARGAIEVRYFRDVDGRDPVAGAVFALCRVAEVTEEGRYRLLHDLTRLDPAWEKGAVIEGGQLQEVDRSALASALYLTSNSGADEVRQAATGTGGTARFEDLAAGLYLCAEIKAAAGMEKSVPILLPIPSESAGGKTGEETVTILNPKPVLSSGKEERPSTPVRASLKGSTASLKGDSVVKTGDLSELTLWSAAAGLALRAGTASAGFLRRRAGKEEQ